jgi:glycosyltransferase involved in cell wall biosynthesis
VRYYLVGPSPPPLGGISVHVSRRAAQLRREGHIVSIVDLSAGGAMHRWRRLSEMLMSPGEAVFEVHTYDFTVFAVLLARPFRKRLTYTDHNTPLYGRSLDPVRRGIFQRFLLAAEEVAFVSERLRTVFLEQGYRLPHSTVVRNAFLPPPVEDEARIWGTYDEETVRFAESHSPLIVANASEILFYDGVDLYGLDMCVDLASRITSEHPRAGVLFVLGNSSTNADYISHQLDRARTTGAESSFHLLTGQRELWPLLKRAEAVIRPTTSDGYAVSLQEALYFGTPVVASDVSERPPGAICFPSRDVDGAYRALLMALGESDQMVGS